MDTLPVDFITSNGSGNALGQRAVTAAEIEYGLVGLWGEKIQNLGAKVGDETRIALVPGCVPCLRPAAELAISRET